MPHLQDTPQPGRLQPTRPEESGLREKCGVFGLIAPKTVAMGHMLYFGLYALQHRGQESCGMAVFDNDELSLRKGLGLVSQVFADDDALAKLRGQVGVGHTRYSTAGGETFENAQPVICRSPMGSLVLAHNGNLIQLQALREAFHLEASDTFGADSDSHVMARCIAQALRQTQGSLVQACKLVFEQCQGAFSVVVGAGDRLIAARDAHGIRPLCIGRLENGAWVAASETCALDIVGADYVRDLEPGEVFVARRDGTTQSVFLDVHRKEHFCVFEYVYFARPDSQLHGQTVYSVRLNMGRALAQQYPVEADVVMGVPDSGSPAAVGYSQESGIPYMEGLIKNRYVGRTFIHPTQELRERGLRLKLNPLASLLQGKRVVVVDDSIVRGTTSLHLVELLRECGVRQVHLRVSSAPVKHPCFYGIDMSTEDELIANHKTVEQMQQWLGVDSLGYLDEATMARLAMPDGRSALCMACFNNQYPAGQPAPDEWATGCC